MVSSMESLLQFNRIRAPQPATVGLEFLGLSWLQLMKLVIAFLFFTKPTTRDQIPAYE